MTEAITFIIPTYNHGHHLSRAIESVTNQTKTNWKLIIVDDGSTDHTSSIVDQYCKEDCRLSYIKIGRGGVSKARNVGITLCTTNYLIFLDADDELSPNLLNELDYKNFDQFDLITWSAEKRFVNDTHSIVKPKNLGGLYQNYTISLLSGTICYKKDLLMKAGLFDTYMTFGENYELGLRICQQPLKILEIGKVLLTINIAIKRTSTSFSNRLYSGFHQYQKHRDIYKNNPEKEAELLYILGFLLQKNKKIKFASKFYVLSFKCNPLNYKSLLRIVQTKLRSL